jgi:hypothetical protein
MTNVRFHCPRCDGLIDGDEWAAMWHFKEPDGCQATFDTEPEPIFLDEEPVESA